MTINDIEKKLCEFANRSPAKGFEVTYLKRCGKVVSLYDEALMVEEEENEQKEKKFTKIFKEMEKLM